MLVGVLSDVHAGLDRLQKIREEFIHNKVELLLLLGDLTSHGPRNVAVAVLNMLNFAPLLALPGNLDTLEVATLLEQKMVSLHRKCKEFQQWNFIGYGGGLIGQVGNVMSTEAEIGKEISQLLEGSNSENTVLATHLPPYNTKLDFTHHGTHVGSKSIRQAIEKFQPRLNLCGHIHEAAGEEKIGKCDCINVGAAKEGKALLLSLGEEIKWQRIEV